MQMPMDVAFEQAKQELARVVNYCLSELKLPMFLVSTAIADVHREVVTQADFEYHAHVQEYNEALATQLQAETATEENIEEIQKEQA